MSSLFPIINEYEAIIAELEENGGELTPELAEKLAITETTVKNKIKAYYYIIKSKEAEIKLADDEIDRLKQVTKTKENVIKRLKKLVDLALEVFGVATPTGAKKMDLEGLKVWQKKTEALEVTGDIDDERFCNKEIKFELSYNDTITLLGYLETSKFTPSIKIKLLNDKLKQWLLDNEEEHNALKNASKDITPNIAFETEEITNEINKIDKDLDILLKAKVNHNSTVIFR